MISRARPLSSGLRPSIVINQLGPTLSSGSTKLLDTEVFVFVYVLAEFGFRTEGELCGFGLSSDSELSGKTLCFAGFALSSESELRPGSGKSA